MGTLLLLGSNADVGQACAYRFAKEGYNILLATRTIDDYQKKLASDIAIRHNVKVENVHFDALQTQAHKAFYESLSIAPDVVVSVFGYLGNHEKGLADFEEAQLIIDSNFTGNVSILGIIANAMEAKKQGSIVCVSSVAGERGRKSNYLYGASKAALTAFLSGLRGRMFASNVHVATVIPGFIKTKMVANLPPTPKPITASAEQVADAIWKAYNKKKDVVYVLSVWWLIMFIIKSIPEALFKKTNL
jgi:decaprenylphospho-beta-D-erythro-pentofuranosid-2-ulose 2-reductase